MKIARTIKVETNEFQGEPAILHEKKPEKYDREIKVVDKQAVYAFEMVGVPVVIEQVNSDGTITLIQSVSYEEQWVEKEPEESHQEYVSIGQAKDKETALKLCHKARKEAYGSIEDQLDMIYHKGLDGWQKHIKKIKKKYPLPSKLNELV